MEENKKSKLGLGILIGLLIAVIIVLAGFIVYDKVLTKDDDEQFEIGDNKENDEKEQVIETELDLSSTLVSSLSKVFHGRFLSSGASKYDNYFYEQDKTTIANIPDELKMVMTFYMLNTPDYVSDSEFAKAYKQIFGSNAIVPNTVPSDCESLVYEHVNGVYKVPDHGLGCGGTSARITFTKLIDAKLISNSSSEKIIISEAVAFMTFDSTTNQNMLYKDVDLTEFVEIYNYDFVNTVYQSPKNPLDDDYSKYAQYDYTFEKDESGIYVFTSVERVK